MSQLTEHVTLTITVDTVGQARAGFGTPAIVSHTATWAERFRSYTGISDVGADFATDSPEYLAANAIFAQTPHPPSILILRAALKPTQTYVVGVGAVGVGDAYAINVKGKGVTATTVSYTSLADLTFGTVTAATDEITITAHGMSTGDGPFYVSNSGGALPSPLAANTSYWVIKVDADNIKLATSKANALASTAIDLTTAGTGTQTLLRSENDVVIAQLVQGLNAVVGANYAATATGSTGSQVATVTASVSGNWFSLEVTNYSLLTIKQTHADPGIATDLAAIQIQNDDWYVLYTTYNSTAYVLAAAAWIETQSKIYLADVNETDSINVAVGASPTDTLYQLFSAKYNRTAGSFYPALNKMFGGAWAGRVLPDDPGSETWKGKTLAGIDAVNLTSTQRANLRARKANTYTLIGSENKTWEGTVAGGSYGFIDVTRGIDWLVDDITKGVFDVMFSGEKLPYTNAGIAVVRSEIKSSLRTAVSMGILADTPTPEVIVPDISAVSSSDKALRNLSGVKFSGVVAGAIHTVAITGNVTA